MIPRNIWIPTVMFRVIFCDSTVSHVGRARSSEGSNPYLAAMTSRVLEIASFIFDGSLTLRTRLFTVGRPKSAFQVEIGMMEWSLSIPA